MSEEVNNEQTKGAKQEEVTELTDDQLDEVAGGGDLWGEGSESEPDDGVAPYC